MTRRNRKRYLKVTNWASRRYTNDLGMKTDKWFAIEELAWSRYRKP